MTVTELIAMIDGFYPNSVSTANKISYMNSVLDHLSARGFGLFVEDTSVVTVTDQEGYAFPTGLLDIADIDFLGVASTWPKQARKIICTAGAGSQSGNITLVVTAASMTGTPVSVVVAVTLADSAATVAGKVRTALEANAQIAAFFVVSGATTNVILTALTAANTDATMDIAFTDTGSTGVTFGADADSTIALLRSDYEKYVPGFMDELPFEGKFYFQIVSSAGAKTLGLFPVPTDNGLKIMIRYNKSITALASGSMSASPEIDSRFHEMLAFYATHQVCANGPSADSVMSNLYLVKYLDSRKEFLRLMFEREEENMSDRREGSWWARRRA